MYVELMVRARMDELDREARSSELRRAVRELKADRAPGRRTPDPALYGRVGWANQLTEL